MPAFRKKKRNVPELSDLHYRNVEVLKEFVNDNGSIAGRRHTGFTAKKQRLFSKAVKQARAVGLLSFVK